MRGSVVSRACHQMVERVFDDATKLRHIKFLHRWVGGSVVERVPDKNEVHGSIPCAPTLSVIQSSQLIVYGKS